MEPSFQIVHINLNVLDLERSIAFYQKALGLRMVHSYHDPQGDFKLVFLEDDTAQFQIELTWLAGRKTPYHLGDNGTHIAFATSLYDKAYQLHQAMGIICYENLAMGVYFIGDPDGHWIEIIPKGPQK